jgi:hypothetical protein
MTQAQVSPAVAEGPGPEWKIEPVERRPASELPYEKFLSEYVVRNRPVIIQDACPEWPALRRWTPEFFREKFGSRTVEVTYGVRRPLAEVIDGVLRSTAVQPGPYLHKVIIHQHMPELLADLTPESVYGFPCRFASPLMPSRFRRPDGFLKLLIGGVGGKFPLMHFDSDNANAIITEIYGDKEFVLFAPEETPLVYPHSPAGNTSQIDDLDHPDLARFPLFPRATQYRGIIGPGEAIFVPSRWWHTARVVTTSISVCSNMLHASNWRGFVVEACSTQNGNWAARNVKRVYLDSAGAIMTAAEQSQKRFPRAAASLRLGALCPAGAATLLNRSRRHA